MALGIIKDKYITADDIITAIPRKVSPESVGIIKKACEYAKEKHGKQERYSGIPYYTHVFEVGKLLAEVDMSVDVIVAGILHDTIEDTEVSAQDLVKEFNKEISFFVEGVSHLGEVRYQGLDTRVKSLQKLFVATSQDVRVIIIKLMDRLHNMRTIGCVPKEKQKRIIKETQKVYVPIADRLGMGKIKVELEELSFKTTEPKIYKSLKDKIDKIISLVSMKDLEKKIKIVLSSNKIMNHEVSSRIKSTYSTYMKMEEKKYSLEQVHDIIAFRVLVDDASKAYNALGVIHANWPPIPGTFKDYISFPKPNKYQALHTRVLINKHITEIQILTYAMFKRSQFGVAAHFNYKDKRHNILGIELRWFEKLLTSKNKTKDGSWFEHTSSLYPKEHSNDKNFIEDIEADFLQQRMFIFTPKGEVVDLPRKATVADFAFAIHTDIGLSAEGAFVNKKYVSLKHQLENGDVVQIQTGKKKAVSEKWLDWVKTAEARSSIRHFIKKNS